MLPEDEAALEFICASNYMYLLREYYIVFPAAAQVVWYATLQLRQQILPQLQAIDVH